MTRAKKECDAISVTITRKIILTCDLPADHKGAFHHCLFESFELVWRTVPEERMTEFYIMKEVLNGIAEARQDHWDNVDGSIGVATNDGSGLQKG